MEVMSDQKRKVNCFNNQTFNFWVHVPFVAQVQGDSQSCVGALQTVPVAKRLGRIPLEQQRSSGQQQLGFLLQK